MFITEHGSLPALVVKAELLIGGTAAVHVDGISLDGVESRDGTTEEVVCSNHVSQQLKTHNSILRNAAAGAKCNSQHNSHGLVHSTYSLSLSGSMKSFIRGMCLFQRVEQQQWCWRSRGQRRLWTSCQGHDQITQCFRVTCKHYVS